MAKTVLKLAPVPLPSDKSPSGVSFMDSQKAGWNRVSQIPAASHLKGSLGIKLTKLGSLYIYTQVMGAAELEPRRIFLTYSLGRNVCYSLSWGCLCHSSVSDGTTEWRKLFYLKLNIAPLFSLIFVLNKTMTLWIIKKWALISTITALKMINNCLLKESLVQKEKNVNSKPQCFFRSLGLEKSEPHLVFNSLFSKFLHQSFLTP